MRRKPGRKLTWALLGAAAVVVATAIPILRIETRCIVAPAASNAAGQQSLLKPEERRDEINSYLTYPEWSIVHAYEDLAAVSRRGSESDYDYFRAIGDYWRSLCYIARLSSSRGTISGEYKVMLYVIGVSFAAEMGIKGAWEQTVGRVTAWLRGPAKTPEDEFAQTLADDYAAFLRQTPWYDFPFGARLTQFWRETPLLGGNPIRKLERRLALTLEWGSKALYASVIRAGAGATMPAALRLRSVVADLHDSDIAADPRITRVRAEDNSATVIETDRYRTFTEIIQGLAERGRTFREIAGNQRIMITIHAPDDFAEVIPGTKTLLKVPVRAKPGWQRHALDVDVGNLTRLVITLRERKLVLEHIYDY